MVLTEEHLDEVMGLKVLQELGRDIASLVP